MNCFPSLISYIVTPFLSVFHSFALFLYITCTNSAFTLRSFHRYPLRFFITFLPDSQRFASRLIIGVVLFSSSFLSSSMSASLFHSFLSYFNVGIPCYKRRNNSLLPSYIIHIIRSHPPISRLMHYPQTKNIFLDIAALT